MTVSGNAADVVWRAICEGSLTGGGLRDAGAGHSVGDAACVRAFAHAFGAPVLAQAVLKLGKAEADDLILQYERVIRASKAAALRLTCRPFH